MGVAPSASAISRLNRDLEQQFTAWRERRLQEHWRILYLDGIHFSVRHGDQVDSTVILTALGVDLAGNKEVLALRACAEESKEGWVSVLEDRRRTGSHADRSHRNRRPRRTASSSGSLVYGNAAAAVSAAQTA